MRDKEADRALGLEWWGKDIMDWPRRPLGNVEKRGRLIERGDIVGAFRRWWTKTTPKKGRCRQTVGLKRARKARKISRFKFFDRTKTLSKSTFFEMKAKKTELKKGLSKHRPFKRKLEFWWNPYCKWPKTWDEIEEYLSFSPSCESRNAREVSICSFVDSFPFSFSCLRLINQIILSISIKENNW